MIFEGYKCIFNLIESKFTLFNDFVYVPSGCCIVRITISFSDT